MNNAIKWLFSAVAGGIMGLNHRYGVLSLFVCCAVLLDIVTGLLKAKASHEINSNAGYKGFWRKLSLFAGLLFGCFLDGFSTYLLSINAEWSLSFNIPFGTIIGIYIILNECISILENLYACGVKLPAFIVKALKSAVKQADNEDNEKK